MEKRNFDRIMEQAIKAEIEAMSFIMCANKVADPVKQLFNEFAGRTRA